LNEPKEGEKKSEGETQGIKKEKFWRQYRKAWGGGIHAMAGRKKKDEHKQKNIYPDKGEL